MRYSIKPAQAYGGTGWITQGIDAGDTRNPEGHRALSL
jgi:hypothetical protein